MGIVAADNTVDTPTICAVLAGMRSYFSANMALFDATGTDAMTVMNISNALPKGCIRSIPVSFPISITTRGFIISLTADA